MVSITFRNQLLLPIIPAIQVLIRCTAVAIPATAVTHLIQPVLIAHKKAPADDSNWVLSASRDKTILKWRIERDPSWNHRHSGAVPDWSFKLCPRRAAQFRAEVGFPARFPLIFLRGEVACKQNTASY